MAMVQQPMPGPSPIRKRTVNVTVVDMNGAPMASAETTITIDGTPAGRFITGSAPGPHSIELPDEAADIVFESTSQGTTIPPIRANQRQSDVDIVFPISAPRHLQNVVATAECADGTSGSPCVDCPNQNPPVRICA